jgi:chromosome segregation ATPase
MGSETESPDTRIAVLESVVKALDLRLQELTMRTNAGVETRERIKEDVYKITLGLSSISEKILAYSGIQATDQQKLSESIRKICVRVDELVEKSNATTYLQSELITLKRAVDLLQEELDRVTTNTSSTLLKTDDFKSHTATCMEWRKGVNAELENSKKLRYGLNGIYIALGLILLVLSILGASIALSNKDNKDPTFIISMDDKGNIHAVNKKEESQTFKNKK